jgi:hypothetical protein
MIIPAHILPSCDASRPWSVAQSSCETVPREISAASTSLELKRRHPALFPIYTVGLHDDASMQSPSNCLLKGVRRRRGGLAPVFFKSVYCSFRVTA